MKTLWLRPLLTGGFLRLTRRPSCAAAAEGSVTFGAFAVIPAAWRVVAGRKRAHNMRPYKDKGQGRVWNPPLQKIRHTWRHIPFLWMGVG